MDTAAAQRPRPPRLRLAELARSLSLATGLGLGHPLGHALRSCLVSVSLGRLAEVAPDDSASPTTSRCCA